MDDRKDFKTVLLRGLDENQDLVNTINDVMKEFGINTGQGAIFEIIRQYETLKYQNRNAKLIIEERESKVRQLKKELKNHTENLKKLKEVFQYVNEM